MICYLKGSGWLKLLVTTVAVLSLAETAFAQSAVPKLAKGPIAVSTSIEGEDCVVKVCVTGSGPKDPWGGGGGANGGGGVGDTGGGRGGDDSGREHGGGAGNSAPAPPSRTPEQRKAECDRADATRREAARVFAEGKMQNCSAANVSLAAAALGRSIARFITLSVALNEVIGECMAEERAAYTWQLDLSTFERNLCMQKPL